MAEPRYTVALTTEGWQIKDNVRGTIKADVWRSRWQAEAESSLLNRTDPLKGGSRR